MPYDGSGNFTRVMSWQADASAGTKIKADRHDQEDDNFAAGLSTAITKDGQTQPTANIPMNGHKLTNLGAPTNPADAVTKSYVDALKTFTTGVTISGADLNGQVAFTSATGANGLAFTGADLSWLARLSPNRLVLNDKVDGTGTDVVAFSDTGNLTLTGGNVQGAATVILGATSNNIYFRPYGVGNATNQVYVNTSGQIVATGLVYAGAAYLSTDGNVAGSVWSSWGAGDAFNAINARIEARATAWANDRVSQLQYRKVSQGNFGQGPGQTAPAGAVITGGFWAGSTLMGMYYMYLQVYDPVRGWVGFSG